MRQILLPSLKQSRSKQRFSDLVTIPRMGSPLYFLSKTLVLQFQSIDGANVFLNMKALLSSLPPSKGQDRGGTATTGRPTPFQSQTTPSDEPAIVLWLPSLGKWGGEEERLAERGRPCMEEARKGQEVSRI